MMQIISNRVLRVGALDDIVELEKKLPREGNTIPYTEQLIILATKKYIMEKFDLREEEVRKYMGDKFK